ncbi:hypothetical protein DNU06_16515 [Putridiphycobacter roseus]|uniref:DUF819 family protein n=2 Tax=Putridiphycobacter roseus TaxID=2219161 RepID=A0A2W1NJI8_9FLAO|nr:hypothetical protein DNU06_16515 [Putridiphycobacter roseus]
MTLVKRINFDQIGGVLYQDEVQNFVIDFDNYRNYSLSVNDSIYPTLSNGLVLIKDFQLGEHSIALVKTGEKTIKKKFKYNRTAPLITNDAVVFGLLFLVLVLIFRTAEMPIFKKFYGIVPALLLCYFIPAILNSLNIISSDISNLYFVASRYLLPASLILLCLSIDIQGIKRLGGKAVIMFFAATIGIIIGGPIALYLVSLAAPEVLTGGLWRGLATVAGSWIGGGANQAAMLEVYQASDKLFSKMIIVDVVVANIFMSVLLFGTGQNKRLNKFFKADDSAIEALKTKMEAFQKSVEKVLTFKSLTYMLGIVFGLVGLAHLLSGYIAPGIEEWLESIKSSSPNAAILFTSFGSGFFWLVVLSTIFGVILSFTKARNFEGIGASKVGSLFLYILVATIGTKMNIAEMIREWNDFVYLFAIGLIWILIHALFLFVVAKIIKAPFFYVAVGSQANVGGAASAPVVASAFSPALAPVGVLLAVLGYAVGTFGAILCTILMQSISV